MPDRFAETSYHVQIAQAAQFQTKLLNFKDYKLKCHGFVRYYHLPIVHDRSVVITDSMRVKRVVYVEIVGVIFFDVFRLDCDVIVSVWTWLFVFETQGVAKLMGNDHFLKRWNRLDWLTHCSLTEVVSYRK